jgi:hypothetical protein
MGHSIVVSAWNKLRLSEFEAVRDLQKVVLDAHASGVVGGALRFGRRESASF